VSETHLSLSEVAQGSAYLRIPEFALYFKVKPALVRKWIRAGVLPASCLRGEWRIALRDAEVFEAEYRVEI